MNKMKELARTILINSLTLSLSVLFTVYFYMFQTRQSDAVTARSVVYEISYNLKQIQVVELLNSSEKNDLLKTEAWDKFVGTDYFYKLPTDIKQGLINFYDVIHFKQSGNFKDQKWHKLNGKQENPDAVTNMSELLGHWTDPFIEYVREK